MTPQEDIEQVMAIEEVAMVEDREEYLACLNGKPMAERHTEREVRDGCILVNHVYLFRKTRNP